jgi:molecular chaperone GrpE
MNQDQNNGPDQSGDDEIRAGNVRGVIDPAAERSENQTADSGAPADDDTSRTRRERDDYYERLLRKTAEFDNYRKRVERERRDQIEWAAADVLKDILRVLDDFERALQADAPPEAQPYRTGVELIHRQLSDLVRKRGATPIEALGADFDPTLHQAIAYEETPGAREGEVVAEFAKGYKLGERLLRPAMVKVAKAS